MIKYSITKNDIKIQAKDLAVFKLKPLLIIGAVALPLSIFFLIVGYAASEPEALKMGYPTLLIFALSVIMFVAQYSAFGKALLASFEKNAEDGKMEYSIAKIEGNIEIARTSDKFSFATVDVEKVSCTKTNIIVRLGNKKLLAFPKQEDILKLLDWRRNHLISILPADATLNVFRCVKIDFIVEIEFQGKIHTFTTDKNGIYHNGTQVCDSSYHYLEKEDTFNKLIAIIKNEIHS